MAQVAYVDWDGLVYYDSKIKKHLTDQLENCLKDGGKKLFVELPDPSYDNLNYVYTVADDFTSTDIFAVIGIDYEAGTVVKVSEIQLNADQPAVYRYTILNQRFSDVDADALNSVNERIKALEDAGFITEIPDDFIDENELRNSLTGYATLSDLQAALDSIPAPDLSDYYTKEEADNKYLTEHQDLSGYAKVEDVDKKISDIKAATDLNSKDIEHILDDLSKAEESISIDHARVDTLISEVGDIKTSVALKPDRADIPTATSQLANDSNYATESFVRNAILDAELNDKEVDLTGYATKDDLNTKADKVHVHKLSDIEDYAAPEIPSLDGYATEQFVSDKISEIDIPETDLSNYYNKTETETLVNEAVNAIVIPDTSDFITMEDVEAKGYVSDITGKADKATTLAGYGITDAYTKSEVDAKIAEVGSGGNIDLDGYVSEDDWNQRISNYYTKSEVDDLLPDNYLTEDALNGYAKLTDLDNYAKSSDLPDAVSDLTNDAGYITAGDIPTNVSAFNNDAGYLTQHQDISSKLDVATYNAEKSNFALKTELPIIPTNVSAFANDAKYVDESKLAESIENVSAKIVNADYAQNDSSDSSFIANRPFYGDESLAVEYTAETKDIDIVGYFSAIQISLVSPKVGLAMSDAPALTDLLNYRLTYTVTDNSSSNAVDTEYTKLVSELTCDEITGGYDFNHFMFLITDYASFNLTYSAALTSNGIYLISYQQDSADFTYTNSYDAISIKSTGIVTLDEKYIPHSIARTADIPDVSKLATRDEVSVKANSILFTRDLIVNNAVGSFIVGDNVNGMTLSEIISKLLNLSAPTTPDTPSDSVVEDIVKNNTPMYSIDGEGNVVEVSYDKVLRYTEDTANTQPTESGFYQIVDDNGEVIESGYQELSANNPDVPHIIALPKGVDFNTMVTTEVFNTKTQEWVPTTLNMSNNVDDIEAICSELGVDISHIDQDVYTLWADLEAGPTGSIIRYIITEE